LEATAALWPDIQTAYAWVHQAAHLLANDAGQGADDVRRAHADLLAEMHQHRDTAGLLAPAVDHFLKDTASYWPGLFHCYNVPNLPRTNNDLEQYSGTARYQERRATGRKSAAPGTVVRGAVRVVAAVQGRPATGPLGTWTPALGLALRQLRAAHPGWGPATLLATLRADPCWATQRLPSRARVAALLMAEGLTRRYRRHSTAPQSPPHAPHLPHEEWQLDAQGTMPVAGSVPLA
jgi:hypothetical protein